MIDRSEAVKLAIATLARDGRFLTVPPDVRQLCEAVMAMDAELSLLYQERYMAREKGK